MRYRRLSRNDARALLGGLVDGTHHDPMLNLLGTPIDVETHETLEADLQRLSEELSAECDDDVEAEDVELAGSGSIYLLLRNLPVWVRDDVGFWRWATCGPFRRFLQIRQETSKLQEAIGAGSNDEDILVCRMFLRAQAARQVALDGTLDFSLLTQLGRKNHDFLQSHVVRVPTGAEPNLARALMATQISRRLPTKELRAFVRDGVNRPKTMVATFLMSEEESIEFLSRQASLMLKSK
jgi:hypothetical protein